MARTAKPARTGNRKPGRDAGLPNDPEPMLPGVARRGRKPNPPAPLAAPSPDAQPTSQSRLPGTVTPSPAAPPARRGRKPKQVDDAAPNTANTPKRRRPRAPAASLTPQPLPGEPATPAPAVEAEPQTPQPPAAHWDRATGRVKFDWPAIERTAAEDGPNQAMAKLLLAARAEGATSRWPF